MTEEWHPVSVRQIYCKMHNIMMEVRHTRSDVNSTCGTVEWQQTSFSNVQRSRLTQWPFESARNLSVLSMSS